MKSKTATFDSNCLGRKMIMTIHGFMMIICILGLLSADSALGSPLSDCLISHTFPRNSAPDYEVVKQHIPGLSQDVFNFITQSHENLIAMAAYHERSMAGIPRWAPHLKRIIESGAYKSEAGLIEALKEWNPEIAQIVQHSIGDGGIQLFMYRRESPEVYERLTEGFILSSAEDKLSRKSSRQTVNATMDKNSPKYSFLWFKNLPTGWKQELSYGQLGKGAFGTKLYEVDANNVEPYAMYSMGDFAQYGELRTPEWSYGKLQMKPVVDELYHQMGIQYHIPTQGTQVGRFLLSDRRGLMLWMFLEIESRSAEAGVLPHVASEGNLYQPFHSWFDVHIFQNLKLGQNVKYLMRDPNKTGIPPNATSALSNYSNFVPGLQEVVQPTFNP